MKTCRALTWCMVCALLSGVLAPRVAAQPTSGSTSEPAGTLRIIFDIPCGEDTRIRRVQSPWGVGYYQLKALWEPTNPPTTSESESPEDVTLLATWASSDPSVGTVDVAGFFTGFDQGQTEITATYQGVTSPMFTIVLPEPPARGFPGPSGTDGCNQPDGQHDPDLAEDVDVVIAALQDEIPIAWPVDPRWPPEDPVVPPSWRVGDPSNDQGVSEEGSPSGGAGAWDPGGVSYYPPGIVPEEDPDSDDSDLVYISSNRGTAVVGVDLASSLRLRELIDGNGALVLPPDLSFYDILGAVWCGHCREDEGCTDGGAACSHCDGAHSADCLCSGSWDGSQYPDDLGLCAVVGTP